MSKRLEGSWRGNGDQLAMMLLGKRFVFHPIRLVEPSYLWGIMACGLGLGGKILEEMLGGKSLQ